MNTKREYIIYLLIIIAALVLVWAITGGFSAWIPFTATILGVLVWASRGISGG